MTKTINERIQTRRAALRTQRAERQDELDLPRTMTQRQVNAYLAETAVIDAKIAVFEAAVAAHAALGGADADLKWQAELLQWRDTCSAERLAITSPIRDKALMEQAQGLEWSIKLIDHGLGISTIGPIVSLASTRIGELMAAAGYATSGPELRGPRGFRGSLPDVEQRLTDLAKQRAAAQAALDAVLMTDEERAAREAEVQAYRDALTRLHLKGNSDGTGYVVLDEDGDVRDLATLTPAERTAFERADAAYRQERQDTFDRQLGR